MIDSNEHSNRDIVKLDPKLLEDAKERLKDVKMVLHPSPPLLVPSDVVVAIRNLRNAAADVVKYGDIGRDNLRQAIEHMDQWL